MGSEAAALSAALGALLYDNYVLSKPDYPPCNLQPIRDIVDRVLDLPDPFPVSCRPQNEGDFYADIFQAPSASRRVDPGADPVRGSTASEMFEPASFKSSSRSLKYPSPDFLLLSDDAAPAIHPDIVEVGYRAGGVTVTASPANDKLEDIDFSDLIEDAEGSGDAPPPSESEDGELDKLLVVPPPSRNRKAKFAVDSRIDVSRFHALVPNMAYQYKFDLDTWQKEAIYRLETGNSVFVAAHTSAGKTVVAEYAIAMALRHRTRVIYTSPIKTLSNQKYREFKDAFGDVGIITGDVSVNPTAELLIMTTEILRSMLYKGADIIRDVEFVIFDEVHYVSDESRGVVWEEVIILLPRHVALVLLSASVPNALEFADWIGRTRRAVIYVTGTTRRPVPLEHHILLMGGKPELVKVVDAEGVFLSRGYSAVVEAEKKSKGGGRGRGHGGNLMPLIEVLRTRGLLPCIVFTFSRRGCEESLDALGRADLAAREEKAEVRAFVAASYAKLSPPDRRIPELKRMQDALERGIGVHHAGLLPITKEIVEMLFQRGLIKVLFATETFAMGVNMPARTVVFNNVRKHDGRSMRYLSAAEFTQMAGRAGRRGIDTTGLVVLCCWDGVPDAVDLQAMMLSRGRLLQSQFRLTFNMLLNLLRVDSIRIEDVIRRSYGEVYAARQAAEKRHKLEDIQRRLAAAPPPACPSCGDALAKFCTALSALVDLADEFHTQVIRQAAAKYLVVGRIVFLTLNSKYAPLFTPAIVARVPAAGTRKYTLLSLRIRADPAPPGSVWSGAVGDFFVDVIVTDDLSIVAVATKHKAVVSSVAVDRRDAEGLAQSVGELVPFARGPTAGDLFDPLREYRLNGADLIALNSRRTAALECILSSACMACPLVRAHWETAGERRRLEEQREELQFALSDQALVLLPMFDRSVRVLQTLGYLDERRTVTTKGRAHCEMNSCEKLIVTEAIFDGVLLNLSAAETAALLSAFVCKEKMMDVYIPDTLVESVARVNEIAKTIFELEVAEKLEDDWDAYRKEHLNFSLIGDVLDWAKGVPFAEICSRSEAQAGIIVRSLNRLHNLLTEVRSAARVMGDVSLKSKMDDAISLIKRDIAFAASLYVL